MEDSIVVDDLNVSISKVFYIAHAILYVNRSLAYKVVSLHSLLHHVPDVWINVNF